MGFFPYDLFKNHELAPQISGIIIAGSRANGEEPVINNIQYAKGLGATKLVKA
jgi:hypothetical protein